jgi:predicted methyltransferase
MKHGLALALIGASVAALTACQTGPVQQAASAVQRLSLLQQAVAHSGRTPANVLRDRYRHPVETLDFFGVDPNDTVVEIWPGGGWYTEILAPYLQAGGGKLILAAPDWGRSGGVDKLKAANPALYGNLEVVDFPSFRRVAPRGCRTIAPTPC